MFIVLIEHYKHSRVYNYSMCARRRNKRFVVVVFFFLFMKCLEHHGCNNSQVIDYVVNMRYDKLLNKCSLLEAHLYLMIPKSSCIHCALMVGG